MKLSGFTIVRNALKYNYPVLESIRSILPVCDEFVVSVGDSQDGTLDLIRSLKDPKIRIVETVWDMTEGKTVLSRQTNMALAQCTGDWAFYLQTDEVVHEADLPRLKNVMRRYWRDQAVDALRFQWLHFYGSYCRYRVDSGWYQKQDRIIRNNGTVESFGDAYGFQRKDGQELRRKNSGCFIYHYGWVQPQEVMTQRRVNAENIGFAALTASDRQGDYSFGDLGRFPVYFGTHPGVMARRIADHSPTSEDQKRIGSQYWWHPARIMKIRYKTGRRSKTRIE